MIRPDPVGMGRFFVSFEKTVMPIKYLATNGLL
jgi:hypothetical protein